MPNPGSSPTNFPNGLSSQGTQLLEGVNVLTMFGANTSALLGGSPVGFSGTIDSLLVVNQDTTKGTLIFSKNGTNFATIIKNGTTAALTGQSSPIGTTTFVPTDVLSVQNVGASDGAQVIVYFH